MTFAQKPAFISELLSHRHVVLELARRDFRSRYLGSQLGIIWAFLHPLAYLFILWLVFEVALQAKPSGDYPYVLWLMAGLFPWFYFSDALNGATTSIIDHAYIVKKMPFPLGVLPMVKILSTLVIHLFLVLAMLLLAVASGHRPSIYWLQLPYYLMATVSLVLGLAWMTSAVAVFFRDMVQVVAMGMQILFWLTPIFWSPEILPARFSSLLQLNPVCYLVQGYRESLFSGQWFWEHGANGLLFWGTTFGFLVGGAIVFKRLRLTFVDVL